MRRDSKRLISAGKKYLRVEALETRLLLAADLIGISPADDGSGGASDNLVLTFSEDVQKGPGLGNIFINNAADGSIIEVVNVNSDRATFDGSTVTIDPVNDLPADTSVYIFFGSSSTGSGS